MPAAVAWWNLLQDQFRQAVSSAMSPEAMTNAAAMAQDAAARFGAPAPQPEQGKAAAGSPGDISGGAPTPPQEAARAPRPAKKSDKS
jgi:hypothetical protein